MQAAGQFGRGSGRCAVAAAEHEDVPSTVGASRLHDQPADQGARHDTLPGRTVHAAEKTECKYLSPLWDCL